MPLAGTPAEPAAGLLTINERHGSVRRDGRWTLPHRLALRTAWCDVMLDLTSAVRSGPELVIELRVRGGNVELVLAPGMVVDANELAARHGKLAISRDAGDSRLAVRSGCHWSLSVTFIGLTHGICGAFR